MILSVCKSFQDQEEHQASMMINFLAWQVFYLTRDMAVLSDAAWLSDA